MGVLAVWIDQRSHNIPLSQTLIQNKAIVLFILQRLREVKKKKPYKKCLKLADAGSQGSRKKSLLHNIKVQGEETSYPEGQVKIINDAVYTAQQIFSVDKAALY